MSVFFSFYFKLKIFSFSQCMLWWNFFSINKLFVFHLLNCNRWSMAFANWFAIFTKHFIGNNSIIIIKVCKRRPCVKKISTFSVCFENSFHRWKSSLNSWRFNIAKLSGENSTNSARIKVLNSYPEFHWINLTLILTLDFLFKWPV